MKVYNSYILSVAALLLSTTVILAAVGQKSVDVYYTAYVIEALIATELFVYLNAKARRGLNLVSAILFAGFLFIVTGEVIKILA